MAAPVFVQAGAGVVVTTGSGTVSIGSTTAGNVIVLHVFTAGSQGNQFSTSAITNIEDLAGTAAALTLGPYAVSVGAGGLNGNHRVVFGRSIAGGTCSIDVGTDGDDLYARLYEFSGVSAGITLASVVENGTETVVSEIGTGTTVPDTEVITNGSDRLACNFIAIANDNAILEFTGETGGDWVLNATFASATGTDGAIGLQTATMASAGTIDGGSYTQVSDPWGVSGFALIPATAMTHAIFYVRA